MRISAVSITLSTPGHYLKHVMMVGPLWRCTPETSLEALTYGTSYIPKDEVECSDWIAIERFIGLHTVMRVKVSQLYRLDSIIGRRVPPRSALLSTLVIFHYFVSCCFSKPLSLDVKVGV